MSGEMTLETIGGGAAVEKFGEELARVVANIEDLNTSATAKRTITLTVTIKPDKARGFGVVEVETKAKLAASQAFITRAYFGEGRIFEDNPHQVTIEDFIGSRPDNVEQLQQKAVK